MMHRRPCQTRLRGKSAWTQWQPSAPRGKHPVNLLAVRHAKCKIWPGLSELRVKVTGGSTMKARLVLIILAALFASACSSPKRQSELEGTWSTVSAEKDSKMT